MRPRTKCILTNALEVKSRANPYEYDDGECGELPMTLQYFSGTTTNGYSLAHSGIDCKRQRFLNTQKSGHLNSKHIHGYLLMAIVNTTIHLMNKTYGRYRCVYIYYDAHVPLRAPLKMHKKTYQGLVPQIPTQNTKCTAGGKLPDIISTILSICWNENKPKMKPIVHLMCKALQKI